MEKHAHRQGASGREAVTEVLRWLGDGAQEIGELFDQWATRRPYRLDDEDRLAQERLRERTALRKRLDYLRRKKLITAKKTQAGLLLQLSDDGRVELLKRLVYRQPTLPKPQVCLVAYDVPVDGNLGRDALRYFLKRIGLKQVQRSLWSTDKDVVAEIQEFIRSAKIGKWVVVYIAEKQ